MSYFAPFIDASGVHMPTYEDRLADLCEAYRNIFGTDAELSASVPDYQLLSVFARALDDTAALVVEGFNARNPMYASGSALDLLLPQYGLTRNPGETDAEARGRIRTALAARGAGSADAVLAALKSLPGVRDAKLYVNDTNGTNAIGVPGHALAAVVRGGESREIARTLWDTKAPGISTWGNVTETVTDGQGTHTVKFTRYEEKVVYAYLWIRKLSGCDEDAVRAAVVPGVLGLIDRLELAAPLNVPQLYGAAYAANPAIADTFVVTDIQVAVTGSATTVRDVVNCGWKEKITAPADGGVTIHFVNA